MRRHKPVHVRVQVDQIRGADELLHILIRLFRVLPVVLLAALGHQHDDPAVAFATGPADPLQGAHGIAHRFVAHNEVHLANVEALLADGRGDQHLVLAALKVLDHLVLHLLRIPAVSPSVGRLSDERRGAKPGVVQQLGNLGDHLPVGAEHHRARGPLAPWRPAVDAAAALFQRIVLLGLCGGVLVKVVQQDPPQLAHLGMQQLVAALVRLELLQDTGHPRVARRKHAVFLRRARTARLVRRHKLHHPVAEDTHRVLRKVLERQCHARELRDAVAQVRHVAEHGAPVRLGGLGTHGKRAETRRVACLEHAVLLQRLRVGLHERRPGAAQLEQCAAQRDTHKLLVLPVHVLLDVKRVFGADLDQPNVQVVHHLLYALGIAAGRRGERQDAKVRVVVHEVANHLAVRIVTRRTVRLVHHHAHHIARVAPGREQVVLERLGGHVKDALLAPLILAQPALRVPRELDGRVPRQAAARVACLLLLRDQRAGGRHKDDLASREPAEHVEDHYRGDERLAEARRQRHQHVVEERLAHDVELVRTQWFVGRVYPRACLLLIDAQAHFRRRARRRPRCDRRYLALCQCVGHLVQQGGVVRGLPRDAVALLRKDVVAPHLAAWRERGPEAGRGRHRQLARGRVHLGGALRRALGPRARCAGRRSWAPAWRRRLGATRTPRRSRDVGVARRERHAGAWHRRRGDLVVDRVRAGEQRGLETRVDAVDRARRRRRGSRCSRRAPRVRVLDRIDLLEQRTVERLVELGVDVAHAGGSGAVANRNECAICYMRDQHARVARVGDSAERRWR